MRWKQIRRLLSVIGIGIFIYLLIKLDVVKVFQEIENVNWYYIILAIIFVLIFLVTQTIKWFIIARKQKMNLSFGSALRINLISDFYGFITPAKLGSIIKVDYLKSKGDAGRALSNFVIDKILDLSSLFVLAIGFGLLFSKKVISLDYLYLIVGIFLIMILLSLFFYKKKLSKPLMKVIYKIFIPKRMKEKSRELFESFYREMPSFGFLLFAFVINLMNWIVDYSVIYLIGLSLGIDIGFIPFLIVLPISTLVAQLPITINGLGTRELTMISLFALFGVDAVKIFSMSILNIIITNIFPSILAIPFLFRRERK